MLLFAWVIAVISKINRLARGIFDKAVPELEISETKIEKDIRTDSRYTGSFAVRSVNDVEARGVVSSDCYRITIKNPTFIGMQAVINYEVNAEGVAGGEKIQGTVFIISNGGEQPLPFEFTVTEESVDTSLGVITNLFHFTDLVQNSYDEALALFCSEEFAEVFLKYEPKLRTVYEGLMNGSSKKLALEEFLIYINKKNRIKLRISDTVKQYDSLTGNFADKLVLRKENWGYGEITISAEGDFIHLTKKNITTEDFAGNTYEIKYLLEKEMLHAGANYGRINITAPQTAFSCDIVVNNSGSHEGSADRIAGKKGICGLSELYFAFRLRRLSTDVWAKQSLKILEEIRGLDDSSDFLKLFQAQVYIAKKKPEEAVWFLNYVADHLLEQEGRQEFLYSYYLYVRTLYTKNESVTLDALRQIKTFYEKGGNDFRIMWILLYLDEEYSANKSLRLARIKEQYTKGARSPFLYFEACAVFNEQPALLRVLNSFEIQALWWGCRNNMLNEKVALQLAELVNPEKRFDIIIYKIMAHFCKKYEKRILLEVICGYLVRNAGADRRFFEWYARGVEDELKITGLYESYVKLLDASNMAVLPQKVALYFSYTNELDSERKAFLYANILHNEKVHPSITASYMPHIKRFAQEQIKKGNISGNLAFIYRKVIHKADVTRAMAEIYPELLLTCRLKCTDASVSDSCVRVIVKHNELNREDVYPLKAGEAYFPVYTEDVTVLLEDEAGRRFCADKSCECSGLLHDEAVIRHCFELCNENIGLCLHICEKDGIYRQGEESGAALYKRVAEYPEIKPYFKNLMYRRMIDYFSDNYDSGNLDFYLQRIDTDSLDVRERTRVTELLLIRGLYDKAYGLMKKNGYDNISPNRLMRFCTMYLLNDELSAEDSFFTGICAYVFHYAKYDERILSYLLKYYNSTTKNLLKLWSAAREFIIDTSELEERLIVQMLFAEVYISRVIDVFETYYRRGRKSTVIQAYLNSQSYLYFVNDTVIPSRVFDYLEYEMHNERELQNVAKMALLRHYSELPALSGRELENAENLMRELCSAGYIFAFYQNLAGSFSLPEELKDKTILEYRTCPGRYVELKYLFEAQDGENDEYHSEIMEESYEGSFVRPFIMFYGEELKYYITENQGEQANLTESGTLNMSRWQSEGEVGSYELLNDICTADEMKDEQTLVEAMRLYEKRRKLANEWFLPL